MYHFVEIPKNGGYFSIARHNKAANIQIILVSDVDRFEFNVIKYLIDVNVQNMIERSKFIIFKSPEFYEDLSEEPDVTRSCTFTLGSYNKRLISEILKYNGLKMSDRDVGLVWGSSSEVDEMSPRTVLQRFNHFPYSKKILGNKAELAYIIQNNPKLRQFPRFFPKTFILPRDREILYRHMRSNQTMQFIAKPPNGSCGHGIKIVTFADFYGLPQNSVVSEYISRPLCIDGFKFDLRVYVLVTSFAPLRAFVCKEGLARFATESYSTVTNNVFSHLTNASLNKKGKNWCSEFKWKLSDLLQEIEHRWNRSPDDMMRQIQDVVSRTLALVQHVMAPSEKRSLEDPFFELYGFDLLIDKDFNMWLIEINTFPSLGIDEEVDFEVKGPMLAQALSIVGIPDLDGSELRQIQDTFDPASVDIHTFERALVKREDERNRASGDGFIRIFPSEVTRDLREMLTIPKLIFTKKPPKREEKPVDPIKLAKELGPEQAMQVLVAYLSKLHKMMDDRDLGDRITTRVTKFLAAQGYQVTQQSVNIKAALKNFIERQKARCAITLKDDQNVSAEMKTIIASAGDDFTAQVLLHTEVPVRNLRTLFY